MVSQVVKRSVVIGGHKTSVSLEEAFYKGLKALAASQGKTMFQMIEKIDEGRFKNGEGNANLSSAIRLEVLGYYQGLVADALPPPLPEKRAPRAARDEHHSRTRG